MYLAFHVGSQGDIRSGGNGSPIIKNVLSFLMLSKLLYYWPQMTRHINNFISKCPQCEEFRDSKPNESCIQSEATKPF